MIITLLQHIAEKYRLLRNLCKLDELCGTKSDQSGYLKIGLW